MHDSMDTKVRMMVGLLVHHVVQVKYLSNYRIDCHEILDGHLGILLTYPYFSFSATSRLKFTYLVKYLDVH